jgi:hypothetical protein
MIQVFAVAFLGIPDYWQRAIVQTCGNARYCHGIEHICPGRDLIDEVGEQSEINELNEDERRDRDFCRQRDIRLLDSDSGRGVDIRVLKPPLSMARSEDCIVMINLFVRNILVSNAFSTTSVSFKP